MIFACLFLLFVLLRCPRTINIPCPRRHVAFRPLDRQDLREAAEFPMCIVRARASRSPRCDAGRVPWTAVIPSVTSQSNANGHLLCEVRRSSDTSLSVHTLGSFVPVARTTDSEAMQPSNCDCASTKIIRSSRVRRANKTHITRKMKTGSCGDRWRSVLVETFS